MKTITDGLMPLLDIILLLLGMFIILTGISSSAAQSSENSNSTTTIVNIKSVDASILALKIDRDGKYVYKNNSNEDISTSDVGEIKENLEQNKEGSRPFLLIILDNLNSQEASGALERLTEMIDDNNFSYDIVAGENFE